ncbi:hypothetical protein BC827DRAFT_109889 [Russula dissimulans]|nr:hypothetical protein BC827DRAFT_109889 [Russula dissimulans]
MTRPFAHLGSSLFPFVRYVSPLLWLRPTMCITVVSRSGICSASSVKVEGTMVRFECAYQQFPSTRSSSLSYRRSRRIIEPCMQSLS